MKNNYIILISILLFSCVNESTNNNTNEEADIAVQESAHILVYTKYNLPLPVDFYRFLKRQEPPKDYSSYLNNPENVDRYTTNKERGINFGIYASDLAYCVVFEEKQLSIDYFNVTKELADNLHIAKGYTMDVVERLNNNINNNDSLHNIASKSYWSACNFLEANNEVNILPFVVFGGWVESIYLAVISVDENNPPVELLNRLSGEKQALNNLINYFEDVIKESNSFEINNDLEELTDKLESIKKAYDSHNNATLSTKGFYNLKKEIIKVRNFYVD